MRVGVQYRKDPSKDKIFLNQTFKLDTGELHDYKAIYQAERLVLLDTTLDKVSFSPLQVLTSLRNMLHLKESLNLLENLKSLFLDPRILY